MLQHLGSKYPIIQAPMGWIARSKLASAVSNAAPALSGQSVGPIDEVKSVKDIINQTVSEFNEACANLSKYKLEV